MAIRILDLNKEPRIYYNRHRDKYVARFFIQNGAHIDRVIKTVEPSAKAFEDEPQATKTKAYIWMMQESNRLADEHAFSERGHHTFENAMQEYIKEGRRHRRNTGFESHARAALKRFGKMRIAAITRSDVRTWITDMEQEFSNKTIANRLDAARSCFTWLIKEEKFTGANPFSGHEWHSTIEGRTIKPTITPSELQFIIDNINAQTRQAAIIGYYTGLRPFEICGVQAHDINHENLYMDVRIAKSRKRAATRRIAIPGVLSAHIINAGFIPMNPHSVATSLERFRNRNPEFAGLCMETFRHNFSNMMRLAGIPADCVDLHQGRTTRLQDSVYNAKDPMFVTNMMRPHLQAVFGAAVRAVR
jgi:integrase